ncbi:MAG: hypothetical protein H0U57_00045 [Tatlockia sp.]|nr:hypothetical protein [Tatlockia sp.]
MAHELRIPLTNLKGEAEIALSMNYSPAEYRQLIESSLEELDRLYEIIENLLFLAKSENPNITLQKSLIKVEREIHLLVNFYQALADDKNINIICEGEGEIRANATMIRRMISNLLSNAIKYSSNNGVINIRIYNLDSKSIQIILQDTGTGIAKEHLSYIFQRFYRADSARSSNIPGIGLGLAIVKSIIDLHKGTISLTSKLNEGTKFVIILPK